MARKRMIDPSFWVDEKLGTVEIAVRLLFMGLISQADDEGRLNGHPALLKSLIYPYDAQITLTDVEAWLNLLAADERKLITRYEVDHQKYILITNFKKHQTINKPVKSKLPELPVINYRSPTVVLQESEHTTTAQEKLKEEKLREEEDKRSEGSAHSPFNDPIKDRIYQFAIKCEIKSLSILVAETDLFFFVDKMEVEVIEEALKKAAGKKFGYAQTILTEWWNEGKTTIAHFRQRQPQRSFAIDTSRTHTGKHKLEVVKDNDPAPEVTPEELERMLERARKLKGESA